MVKTATTVYAKSYPAVCNCHCHKQNV